MPKDSGSARLSWGARVQAGVIAGLLATIFSISHASLVTGAVAPEATAPVIGMALTGTVVLSLVLGAFSGARGVVPMVQDVPSAALGAMLVAVVTDRAGQAAGVTTAEIVALCLFAGLIFSLSLYAFGRFRLAALMRFVPRPVIAGFLAGTGYFVVAGAIGICTGGPLALSVLPDLLAAPQSWKLLTALGVALALILGSRFLPVPLTIAGVFALGTIGFHVASAVTGTQVDALTADGWILRLPDGGLPWPPLDMQDVRGMDLHFLLGQLLPLGIMVVLATAALLMNTAAIEAKMRIDLRLDRELKLLGLGNLLSMGLGGMPGYHGVASTLSAQRIAAPHRSVTFLVAGCVLAVLLAGNTLLTLLPMPIFAGFMFWVGGDLMRDWLIREIRVTPPGEALLTLAIFAVVVSFGLFEGTIFGLVAGALLFVVDYSRFDPVRAQFLGDAYHGSGEMTAEELQVLQMHGQQIAILKLQGYVFFGTAYRLRERMKALTRDRAVRFFVLDFEAVTGLDATAVNSFRRIADDLEENRQRATLTGLSPRVAQVLRRAGLEMGPGGRLDRAEDMNSGLSAFERRLLDKYLPDGDRQPGSLVDLLEDLLSNRAAAERLADCLDRVEPPEGAAFITEGHRASDLYVLERGAAEVFVGQGKDRRLVRVLGAGAIIGEIAFYRRGLRTSTVVAGAGCVLWRLSAEEAARVLAEDPELSSRFHAGLAARLAERVDANTRLIRTLRA